MTIKYKKKGLASAVQPKKKVVKKKVAKKKAVKEKPTADIVDIHASKPKATTLIKDKSGAEVAKEEHVGGALLFSEPPAIVGVKMGYTKNMGNYESARIDVTLDMPCKEDDLDETFKKVNVWVDDRLSKLMEEMED